MFTRRDDITTSTYWLLTLQLDNTSKAFHIWEKVNDFIFGFLRSVLSQFRSILKARRNLYLLLIHKKISKKSKTDFTRGSDRAFERVRNLQQRILFGMKKSMRTTVLADVPTLANLYYTQLMKERILKNFLKSWVIYYRARKKRGIHDYSIFILDSTKVIEQKQVCWAISKESFRKIYFLLSQYNRENLQYLKVELSSSNMLYILWLVNPAVLAAMFGIFVTCDLLLPWLIRKTHILEISLKDLIRRKLLRKEQD